MSKTMIYLLLLCLFLVTGPALAQSILNEPMTSWTHQGSAPGWTDDVSLTGSDFGKVDQLNSTTTLSYSRTTPLTMGPGTYVAACRVQKFKDTVGAAPLTMEVITGSQRSTAVLPIAHQTIGAFVHTPAVVFTIDKPNTPVVLFLKNTDTQITKQNYYFDSFRIGKVDIGKVFKYQSINRQFGGAWVGNATYYTKNLKEDKSPFGEVLHLNSVWWLENHNHVYNAKTSTLVWNRPFILDPGTYTVSFRIRKNASMSGAYPLATKVHTFDPTTKAYTLLASGSIDTADQVLNQFINSPGLTFKITKPQTQIRVKFINTTSTLKSNYDFDAVSIQKGGFESYGTAGKSSVGDMLMSGLVPQLGQPFDITVKNVASAAIVFFGLKAQSMDLSALGMPGNTLLTDLTILSPALQSTNNVVNYKMTFPNVSAMLGATFYAQALAADAAANTFGVVFSNGCKAEVEN